METILTQWKNRTMSGTSLACNKLWLYKCKGVHILSWFPNILEGEILFFFLSSICGTTMPGNISGSVLVYGNAVLLTNVT